MNGQTLLFGSLSSLAMLDSFIALRAIQKGTRGELPCMMRLLSLHRRGNRKRGGAGMTATVQILGPLAQI